MGFLDQMEISEVYQASVGDHERHTGLAGGLMLKVWLTYLISQKNHTKSHVSAFVEQHGEILSRLCKCAVRAEDFEDTRLGRFLHRISDADDWKVFEDAFLASNFRIYEMIEPVNGMVSAYADSTNAYGYHEVSEDGLMQRGHSKDHRSDLGQLKLMTVTAQPGAYQIRSTVHAGNVSDIGLYAPIIGETRRMLNQIGQAQACFVGDCKMSPLSTRASIVAQGDCYLTVSTSGVKPFAEWVEHAVEKPAELQELHDVNHERIGVGYELVREITGKPDETKPEQSWTERVMMVRADSHCDKLVRRFEETLSAATATLLKLKAQKGRGYRKLTTRSSFEEAVAEILERFEVQGMLACEPAVTQISELRMKGPGRKGKNRQPEEIISETYQAGRVLRKDAEIDAHIQRLGWRAYLTNLPVANWSMAGCMQHYRQNPIAERNYHLLKSSPIGITPLFVHNDDQIIGLTHLLTIATRVLTLLEWQVRRSLRAAKRSMTGLYPGNPKQSTPSPTAVAMLAAAARMQINLSVLLSQDMRFATCSSLPPLLLDILACLRLSPSLYLNLADEFQ